MTRQEIITLYDDNAWANGRALGAAEALTPEHFLRDLGNSFPSRFHLERGASMVSTVQRPEFQVATRDPKR